jgi:hypothetical protein
MRTPGNKITVQLAMSISFGVKRVRVRYTIPILPNDLTTMPEHQLADVSSYDGVEFVWVTIEMIIRCLTCVLT